MNLKAIYNSIVKDTRAVSPVVASLILVIVAVVGAATIGVMMGVIGEDVGEQADADQVGDASKAMIELGSCGCIWARARPIAEEFVKANPGVGFLRHAIPCEHNPYAVSEGIADIGMMGPCGRSTGFIIHAEPDNATLDAFLTDRINNIIADLSTVFPLGGTCNRTNLTYLFGNANANDWMRMYKHNMVNVLYLKDQIHNNQALLDGWETYLINYGVKEFVGRAYATEQFRPAFIAATGTDKVNIYLFTLGDPSPIEQSFINYMRLKSFA